MNTLEILRAARDKIARPENWCQHIPAIDAKGMHENVDSDNAVAWCALGAIASQTLNCPIRRYLALDALAVHIPKNKSRNVSSFNDTQKHQDVLDLFDRAIASLSNDGRGR